MWDSKQCLDCEELFLFQVGSEMQYSQLCHFCLEELVDKILGGDEI